LNSRKLPLMVLLLVSAVITIASAEPSKDILKIKRIVTPNENRMVKAEVLKRKSFTPQVSHSNILQLERERPGALPYARKGLPLDVHQIDTLIALGLRVEFKEEIPDDDSTTGNGLFDMRDTLQFYQEEGHFFDTSPHNKAYFSEHMKAMAHYWWEMSGHTLQIQYEIWPPGDDSTYHLPLTLREYWEKYGYSFQNVLGGYFSEAVALADSVSPDIDFAQPDGRLKPIIIFHPGSDWQNDVNYDSPYDLPTGFMFLTGNGVPVDNGAHTISEGIIMPETVTQDRPGIEWPVRVLNSVMAHEFGHILGTRDIYSTCSFTTRVGDFSLMDNNFADVAVDFGDPLPLVFGVLPASLDIWHKAYLGFVNPLVANDTADIEIIGSGMPKDGVKCVKVPIDNYEYFVIEDRLREFDFDAFNPSIDYPNVILLDKTTSVVMGPGYAYIQGDSLVKVVNGEYDRLLPEGDEPDTLGGLLVFHIDEVVAYQDYTGSGLGNWYTNTLQCDTTRWFMRVVEADDEVDFGNSYHAGYGSTLDLFPTDAVNSITPFTLPFSSASNSGAYTGISITNITAADTMMFFDVKRDITMSGWPLMSVPGKVASHPVPVDIDGDGTMEIFQAKDYILTGYNYDGSGIIDNDFTLRTLGFDGDYIDVPLKIFALLADTASYIGTPSVGDIDGDGIAEVVIGADDGKLYAYSITDSDDDGLADMLDGFPVEMDTLAATTPLLANFDDNVATDEICIASANGVISIYNYKGELIDSTDSIPGVPTGLALGSNIEEIVFACNPADSSDDSSYVGAINLEQHSLVWKRGASDVRFYEPAVGDLDGDGIDDVIVSSLEGEIMAYSINGGELNGWPIGTGDYLGADVVMADINRNGFLEVIVPGNNKVYCFSYNGLSLENFPVELNGNEPVGLINSPIVVGDIDADGYPDIIMGGTDRDIYVFSKDGTSLDNFPLAVGMPVNSSPFIADLDGDGDIDLGARGDDGYINIWDIQKQSADSLNIWPTYGRGPEHRFYHPGGLSAPKNPSGILLSSVYAWPNPTHSAVSHIRYKIGKEGETRIGIRIFDVAGNLMDEHHITARGPSDNEFDWDCSSFASGVYIARVEAQYGSESEYKFTKIAIVR